MDNTLPTSSEWPALVEQVTIVATPVRMNRKGVHWTWLVTVDGVNAEDYIDVSPARTKGNATDMADYVAAEVRKCLADHWNLLNHKDALALLGHGRYATLDPVVIAVLQHA